MTSQLPSPLTVGEGVTILSKMFQTAGIDQPRLDARLIVTHVAGCAPESALVHPEQQLEPDDILTIEQLAERRLNREPIAYLTGVREFWSLSIRVDRNTLTPRSDTEILVECVVAELGSEKVNQPLSILDLGTGSGCILASLLSELRIATGMGVDISSSAAEIAQQNAVELGLSDRMRVIEGDWLCGVSQEFDVVVSNPPYIPAGEIDGLEPEVSIHEPRIALDGGADGLDAYRHIASGLASVLKRGGIAAFEVGQGQATDVCELFHNAGFPSTKLCADLSGIDRVVLVSNDD